MINKDIAIVILNSVQFLNIRFGIDELLKKNLKIDIYIPIENNKNGFERMFDDVFNEMKDLGYNPKRILKDNIHYKILLEPYPMEYYKFNFDYRIKYRYGILCAKPNPVYDPYHFLCYDAILCNSYEEANYLSNFSKTYLIGNMKYINYNKKSIKNKKPILLYLPTYGEFNSTKDVIKELEKLKYDYTIITKMHHGTSFLNSENDNFKKINEMSDEVYDSHTELVKLFEKADVVLSDNSGAIFESLYAEVPVAICSKNINKKLMEFDTYQYILVKNDIIPYTSNPKELSKILKEALKKEYINKQKNIRNQMFFIPNNLTKDFVDIIFSYINGTFDLRYKQLHDVLVSDYYNSKNLIKINDKKIANLNQQLYDMSVNLDNLTSKFNQCSMELNYYRTGKLYKFSKKIYEIKNSIFRRDKNER